MICVNKKICKLLDSDFCGLYKENDFNFLYF